MTEQLVQMRRATPEAVALDPMSGLLRAGHPLVVAFSGGKDSSTLANLAFSAWLAAHEETERLPPLVVIHSDVGSVENPEIRALVGGELDKMAVFAKTRGIALIVRVTRPPLSETFAVRVIGGCGLPVFPDSRRDCTSSWKREPNERLCAFSRWNCAARAGRGRS